MEIQCSAEEAAGGYQSLDGAGPENHDKCQPLFEAVLAEALFVLLGEADWKNSGYNWPGTEFAVLTFLVH